MSGVRRMVQDALHDWAEAVLAEAGLPCPVVWANSGGPREKAPFVSLQMVGSSRRGFPWKGGVDAETGLRPLAQDERMTVGVHGWGEGGMDRLDALRDAIFTGSPATLLRRRGLVVDALTDVSESAEDIANESEAHGWFDIAVTFARRTEEKIGWIERVEVEGGFPANSSINIDSKQEEANVGA